ncbi:MAG: BMC domain-containing protein [Candidatus Hodarchaeales archaeon]
MRAIGVLETNVIARGILSADTIVKTANVKLLFASPVCPGKYLIIIRGSVAAVKSSLTAGSEIAGETLVNYIVIPNVHPEVFPALSATTSVEKIGAIGVIETYSAPAAIMAADEAVKSAQVKLIEIRLSRAIGGKAFVVFTGEVGSVRSALEAGVNRVKGEGLVLSTAVLPAPHPDLVKTLL